MFQLHPYGQNRDKEANGIKKILPLAFIEKAWDQKFAVAVNGSQVDERNQDAVDNTEAQVVKLIKAVEKYGEISKQPKQEVNISEVYFAHDDAP